jgi:1,4-alpha-glucan branching enzyme
MTALRLLIVAASLVACAPTVVRPTAPLVSEMIEVDADPTAIDRVLLVGELPGAPLPMAVVAPGRWRRRVDGLVAGRSYRYELRVHRRDLDRWLVVSDPRAWLLDASRDRQAVLRAGTPAPPRPPSLPRLPAVRDLVIYELCPRELVAADLPFAHPTRDPRAAGPGRVLRAVTARVRSGYFERLGVNALELMPIVASAWTRRTVDGRSVYERDPWGYSALSWYALNGDLGSPEDLAELVSEAHRHGLAVLLDYSLDHGYGGTTHGLLTDLQPRWRKPRPQNRWRLLELELDRPAARAFVIDALRRFLVDYNIDGLRLDWTENVPWPTWRDLVREVRRLKPGVVLISENPLRDLVARAGFDSTWDFFFHWEAPLLLRHVYTHFDGLSRAQVDTQAKLVENLTTWKRSEWAPPGPLVRYLESHDLPRLARPIVRWQAGGDQLLDLDGDGRTPDWIAGGGQTASRLGAVLLTTIPGAIMLFAGQEFGAADALVWRHDPLDWSAFNARTFARYQLLLGLRRRLPELRSDDLRVLLSDSSRHLLAYSRGMNPQRSDDDTVVVVLNLGPTALADVEIALPVAGAWRDALTGRRVQGATARLDLPPDDAVLLLRER